MTDVLQLRHRSTQKREWLRVNEWFGVLGAKTICRCVVMGVDRFVLSEGDRRVGDYESAVKAKEMANVRPE